MHGETSDEVFNISYDYDFNYTYEEYYPLVTLEENNFSFSIINAICYMLIICISLPGNSFCFGWSWRKWVWAALLIVYSSIWQCPTSSSPSRGSLDCQSYLGMDIWKSGLQAVHLVQLFGPVQLHDVPHSHDSPSIRAVVYPVFASSVGNHSRIYTHISSAVAWLILLWASVCLKWSSLELWMDLIAYYVFPTITQCLWSCLDISLR